MIVLCGKTSSGKDSIMKELINIGMERVVTYTTRPMRDGEENGKSYWFMPELHFKKLVDEGFFLETTSYKVANGHTWYYGTPIDGLTDKKAIIMNPDGVKVIKQHPELNPIVFYVSAPDEVLKERLKLRGDNEDEAARRMETDKKDFEDIEKYMDFEVINVNCTPEESANLIYDTYQNMIGEKDGR